MPEECLRKVEEYVDLGVYYFTINGFSKIKVELIAGRVAPSL